MVKRQRVSLGRRCTAMLALLLALLPLSVASFSVAGARALTHALTGSIGGCQIFPANNVWNTDISHLPVAGKSAQYLASIGLSGHLHPDFGSGLYNGAPIGFPYTVVPASQPAVPVHFTYASESDPGPYPIPANASIEGGSQSTGDRHVLVVEQGACKLYEMYASYPQSNGSWNAGSGAVWNLNSNALRPATWTSADAAGLPILPGLVSYDEVASGVINHALRFTVDQTQDSFLWPARHAASSSHDPDLPPMGLRLRLKASVSLASFSRTDQIILTALKQYGMFVADNGSSWYLSGTSDSRWDNDDLHALSSIPGSDFEVVDESSLEMNVNSGQVQGAALAPIVTTVPTPTATAHSLKPTPTATVHPLTPTPTATVISESLHPSVQTASHVSSSASGNAIPFWSGVGVLILLLGIGTSAFLLRRRKRAHTRSSKGGYN